VPAADSPFGQIPTLNNIVGTKFKIITGFPPIRSRHERARSKARQRTLGVVEDRAAVVGGDSKPIIWCSGARATRTA
jgi:hypothetical protein